MTPLKSYITPVAEAGIVALLLSGRVLIISVTSSENSVAKKDFLLQKRLYGQTLSLSTWVRTS
jgi:hypothetical protein